MAIGFSSAAEKSNETWTKEHAGQVFTFGKIKKGPHHFIYNCTRHYEDERFIGDSSTGFVSDHELTRDEIEKRPQFVDFIEGKR